MPNREQPPLGTTVFDRLYKPSSSPIIEDALESHEIDTKPLEHVSLYIELKGKLGLAQLSLQDFDSSTQIASQFFSPSEFSELSPDFKEFLNIGKGGTNRARVKLSVYHESDGNSWMSIEHEARSIEFVFREDYKKIQGMMQAKQGNEGGDEVLKSEVVFEANKVLNVAIESQLTGPVPRK